MSFDCNLGSVTRLVWDQFFYGHANSSRSNFGISLSWLGEQVATVDTLLNCPIENVSKGAIFTSMPY